MSVSVPSHSNAVTKENGKKNSDSAARENTRRPLDEIVLVIGLPQAGKSTYIAQTYPDGTYDDIIDVFHYQSPNAFPDPISSRISSIRKLYLSNALFESDTVEAISRISRKGSKTGRLILEGTFLKSARRASLIQSINNFRRAQTKLICIWISSPLRESDFCALDGSSLYDIPTTDEGFDEVIIWERNCSRDDADEQVSSDNGNESYANDISEAIETVVNVRNERDRITEGDLLGYEHLVRAAGRDAERKVLDLWRGDDTSDGENSPLN